MSRRQNRSLRRQHRQPWDTNMVLYVLKEHKREHECLYRLVLPDDQSAVNEFLRRGCRVIGPDKNNLYRITSEVSFGHLVSKEEWRADKLDIFHGCLLFIGWKLGIPIAIAGLAIYAKVNITVIWLGFFAALCWLGAMQQKEKEYRTGLFWIGMAMTLLALSCWRASK